MAILRSVDGKFFEVPDKDLDKFEIPADQVREKLGDAAMVEPGGPGGAGAGPGGPGGGAGGSQVVIQILGGGAEGGPGAGAGAGPGGGADDEEVQPYWGWWRNCWRNHWRNHWQNCWRNCY